MLLVYRKITLKLVGKVMDLVLLRVLYGAATAYSGYWPTAAIRNAENCLYSITASRHIAAIHLA